MKKNAIRALAVVLTVLMLYGAASLSFAAGAEDNSKQTEETQFTAPYTFEDIDRILIFDPASATLTIGGDGNYINSEKDFWKYINAVAPYAKKVFLEKDALLRNRDASGSDYYLFEKALSALTAVEAFVVEEGSDNYAARNGVLYDSTLTKLIHYPAGKPDESYKMESTTMSIHAFAFCNTQHLRFLEFNYSHVLFPMPSVLANLVSDGSRRHFFSISQYGLGNIEPLSGKTKDSSIKTLIWYGDAKDLLEIAAKHQGNNIVKTASISSQSTSFIKDATVFSNRMLFVLGLSKYSRNATKQDWTDQLTEAFKDIFSAMGF